MVVTTIVIGIFLICSWIINGIQHFYYLDLEKENKELTKKAEAYNALVSNHSLLEHRWFDERARADRLAKIVELQKKTQLYCK